MGASQITGGPNCPKAATATAELEAAKEAEAEAAVNAAATPEDDPAAKAAAVRAAAVATAAVLQKQAALNAALQAKQVIAQGKAQGGRNKSNTTPTGPESQTCKGCGFVGGSWKTCPRNDERSAATVHEDGPGSPGKRRATARKNSDVYAPRLGQVASSMASTVEPPLPKRQRQTSLADLFQK